jgi:two-component system LytT family response regulator
LIARLAALFDELNTPKRQGPRLVIRSNGRVRFVEIAHIDWVEAEGNYVRLHIGDDSHFVRETMARLLAQLGEEHFFRIHRSRIVNVHRIKELRLASGGDYDVVLHSGERLRLSRLQKDALQARLCRRA